MPTRILVTTTSFQDTPGPHHEALAATGAWELVPATDEGQLARIRSARLARLAALGLPVIVPADE